MSTSYRIICCENQKLYPGETFVDIMPAIPVRQEDSLSHRFMEKVRQRLIPDVKCVEYGFILTESDNGELSISYEESYHKDISRYKEQFQEKYEDVMFAAFREMKAQGKDRTFHIDMAELASLYGVGQKIRYEGQPTSIKEERFKEAAEISRRREESYTMQRNYYERTGIDPIERLKQRYRNYSGD